MAFGRISHLRPIGFTTLVNESKLASRRAQKGTKKNTSKSTQRARAKLRRARKVPRIDAFLLTIAKQEAHQTRTLNELARACMRARNALPLEQRIGLGNEPILIRLRALIQQKKIRDVRNSGAHPPVQKRK